jgi:Prealbumin-like fold domain
MRKYLNRLNVPSAIGLLALLAVGVIYANSASADEDASGTTAGTVVTEEEPVLYDLCRTDDDGTTYYFVEAVPESELRDSDVYNGEDGYSVTGQADCDALEPVVEEEPPPPPPDSDGDGINDDSDACVDEAETVNDFEDDDGCPDTPPGNNDPPADDPTPTPTPTPLADSDGDTVNDDVDACPDVAPSVDEDLDGCEDEASAAGAEEDEIIVQQTGSIAICKRFVVPDPTGLEADFEASYVDQAGPDFTLSPGECFPGFQQGTPLPPGSYLVEELTNQLPAGIVFHSIDCTITAGGGEGQDSTFQEQGASVTINLADGDDVQCFFFNAGEGANPGTITVCKQTEPDEEPETSSFTFFTNFSASFDLMDDQCQQSEPLVPGIGYGVREEDPFSADFFLLSISCTGTDQANVTFATGFGTPVQDFAVGHDNVIVELQQGEDVTCTFVDEAGGAEEGCVIQDLAGFGGTEPCGFIQVCKNFGPSVDPSIEASFEVSWINLLGPDFALSDEECNEDAPGKPLAPGDYLVTELVDLLPPGFVFDTVNGINCSIVDGAGEGEDSSFAENGPSVTVTLAAEDSVLCVFNNTEGGTITICKQTIPDEEPEVTEFDIGGDFGDFLFFDDECISSGALAPGGGFGPNGGYELNEAVPDGWTLIDIQCSGTDPGNLVFLPSGEATFQEGDTNVSVDVQSGEDVTCTFINEETDVGGGGDDDDDAGDDDDADDDDQDDDDRVRAPRPDRQRGAAGKPGVGTGDGSYEPFSGLTADGDEGTGVLLPALAFLAVTGFVALACGQWQFGRRGQRR